MIRLHLLGAPRLELDGSAGRRSVFVQPRRAALLAYLAISSPHGPKRRDSLLAMFWPESDTDHARGALRNALHFLRVSLGPAVIRSQGSEEVQIDPECLWCDVAEFERLCVEGDLAAALRLYTGDLMQGFFISEAPEFERWLETERDRLRQQAARAARALAAQAEADGETGLAVHRLRQLLQLAPTDEAVVRHLMRLLAAAGDRGEALRVFEELEARLEHDYGLPTSDATRALAATVRETAGGRVDAAGSAAPLDEGKVVSVPEDGVESDDRAARESGRGRRGGRRAVAAVAATGVALTLTTAAVLLRAGGPDQASPSVIAVLPFEYRGVPEHAYLAEGLADLLAANLDGAGELRAVDPRALLSSAQPVTHPIAPTIAHRQAAAHGAGLFVLGSATEAAGQLRITAALYGPGARPTRSMAEIVVEGGADDVLDLVDRLTLGLLGAHGTTALARASVRTTRSIEALKSFLRGEAALRRAEMQLAIDNYRTAVELDSTFALAHYRLSSAAYRQGIARIPARSAEAALRHAGRLAREDSLLVAAWNHHVSGSALEAHRLYDEALVLRPTHVEAAFQLGELIFHWGSAIGVPAADSREHFGRVLAAEPSNVQAALHLARLAARDGRTDEVDSLVAMMRRADPGGAWTTEMNALRAFLSDDAAWQDQTIAVAAERPNADRALLEHMAAHSYNLAAVERIVLARLGVERSPLEQARMQLFLAQVHMARGRFRDAGDVLASAPPLPPPRRVEYRATMATLPFLPLSRYELENVRAELAAHPDADPRDGSGPLATRGVEYPHLLWPALYRPGRLYLLGALHARLGDATAARAVADSLPRLDPEEPLTLHYERLTRARAAAADGRAAVALGALGELRPPPIRSFESLTDHGRPYERWLRAELLLATGRTTEALRWYATFPDPMARDLAYLAPSHLRRAEIHDAAGDHAQAAVHYGRFVALWAGADSELQPEVERARGRLAEISRR